MRIEEHGWVLADLRDLPDYNQASGTHGMDSIRDGRVLLQHYRSMGRWYPHCKVHGALLKVSQNLWRCPECHEGCVELMSVTPLR